ncbi:MAG: amino acid racemase [Verrucomicrobiota bacterium JB023]|nr:amino acid racemase [Verrucomicrobiota bacterium JB023]
MKKFGLIGGTSWHSTVEYYTTINRTINEHYGDNTNPPLRLINLNQKLIHDYQRADDWDGVAGVFIDAVRELNSLEVEGMALCANTPHKVYDRLAEQSTSPILHIADSIGSEVEEVGITTVGLLGTRFTMSENYIKSRLCEHYGIKTLVPSEEQQELIQKQIYHELSVGQFTKETKELCLTIVAEMAERGAAAIVLGCTEFPLLLKEIEMPIPAVDSIACHCRDISRFILESS